MKCNDEHSLLEECNNRWKQIHNRLKEVTESTSSGISAKIPVTYHNFGPDIYKNYKKEIDELCQKGEMYTRLYLLKSGVIYLMYCIEEGDHGDEDGYGVEPDTWIGSFVNSDGSILLPFELSDHETLLQAEKLYGSV